MKRNISNSAVFLRVVRGALRGLVHWNRSQPRPTDREPPILARLSSRRRQLSGWRHKTTSTYAGIDCSNLDAAKP